MPEFIVLPSGVLEGGGVWLLCIGAVLAGIVRGFSGFGTAMVFLPFAARVLTPFEALSVLVIIDMIGPIPLIPSMLRQCQPRDVLRLAGGLLLALPLGLWMLSVVAPEVFRYAISLSTAVLLILLIMGVRYPGEIKKYMIWLAGALGGFLGGVAGLPGPPVILLYMASHLKGATIRANIFLYLVLADFAMLLVLAAFDALSLAAVFAGVLVAPVYLLANVAGAAIFRPEREKSYRVVAWLVIAGAALSGLPLWDH